MPKLREPPDRWVTGDDIREAWEKSKASFTDGWHYHSTYTTMRVVPVEIGWEYAIHGLRQVHGRFGVNCTTRGHWFGAASIVQHYNWMGWGRPASGHATRDSSESHSPHNRHQLIWCYDGRKLWTLEHLDGEGPYKVGAGDLFSWAES